MNFFNKLYRSVTSLQHSNSKSKRPSTSSSTSSSASMVGGADDASSEKDKQDSSAAEQMGVAPSVTAPLDGAATNSSPNSLFKDSTLFLRDLSRTPKDVILDKVVPEMDNYQFRRGNRKPPRYTGPIPGNIEWPRPILEFIAEEHLDGFCVDCVFQIFTAKCDNPCPPEITAQLARVCVNSFLHENRTQVEECKSKAKYPLPPEAQRGYGYKPPPEKNPEDEKVPKPYDAKLVMQRVLTHLITSSSAWLASLSVDGSPLREKLLRTSNSYTYSVTVIPPIDPELRAIMNQDSENEDDFDSTDDDDDDDDDEKSKKKKKTKEVPITPVPVAEHIPKILPLPPTDLKEMNYQGFIHAIKNTRRKMEDRHVIIPDLNDAFNIELPGNGSFFAVFDGHGGTEGSAFAAGEIPKAFVDAMVKVYDPLAAFAEAFLSVDEKFAVKSKRENLKSGTTGVACFLTGCDLYLSWLGDSQALILRGVPGLSTTDLPLDLPLDTNISNLGKTEPLAEAIKTTQTNGVSKEEEKKEEKEEEKEKEKEKQAESAPVGYIPEPVVIMTPHRPDREDEKQRIEKLGGLVIWFGTWRVNGSIAVSRSIGDVEHKPFVSADCDTKKIHLGEDDDLLILGCDGLFDTLEPQKISQCVMNHMNDRTRPASVIDLPHKLVKESKSAGSNDNITVICVPLIHPRKREWTSQKGINLVQGEFPTMSQELDERNFNKIFDVKKPYI